MSRKLLAPCVACALCLGVLAACGGHAASDTATEASSEASSNATAQGSGLRVVCATFPAYDWVMQVLGSDAGACEVTYLMGSGVDLHSYQPSAADIAQLADADLFVYVGGESDAWAQDAVEAATNQSLRTVSMLEVVGDAAVAEQVVEGMQADGHEHADADHDEEAGHDHGGGQGGHPHGGEGEPGYDEHVWLSLRHAQALVDAIAAELAMADPDHADAYAANAATYKAQLAELDRRYAAAVRAARSDTLVFADRFPFRYLVDDYGLAYHAAFAGCSAETEASFETVAFLSQKVDELGLKSVLVIEGSDQKLAQTVIQGTRDKDQKILVMDSLQSTTDADVAAGKTYLAAMEENLAVLMTALA